MLATARLISEKGGTFPDTPDELQKTEGIGPTQPMPSHRLHSVIRLRWWTENVPHTKPGFGVAESPDLPEGKNDLLHWPMMYWIEKTCGVQPGDDGSGQPWGYACKTGL